MTDLAEFLLDRIAEDEAAARAAGSDAWASWNRSWDASATRDIAAEGERIFSVPMDYDEHVARWSPARVLAECEAKRRIVERVLAEDDSLASPASLNLGDDVLGLLALSYADRPGFREEWLS